MEFLRKSKRGRRILVTMALSFGLLAGSFAFDAPIAFADECFAHAERPSLSVTMGTFEGWAACTNDTNYLQVKVRGFARPAGGGGGGETVTVAPLQSEECFGQDRCPPTAGDYVLTAGRIRSNCWNYWTNTRIDVQFRGIPITYTNYATHNSPTVFRCR